MNEYTAFNLRRTRKLRRLTIAGLVLMLLVLVLGAAATALGG